MAALCKHNLTPATCADCNPRRGVRPAALTGGISARYPGRCAGCGEQIDPDDRIYPNPGADGWLCEECA